MEFSIAEFNNNRTLLVYAAGDNRLGQFVEYQPLQSPLDRPCTELRVVALLGDIGYCIVRDAQVNTVILQHLMDSGNLQADHVANLCLVQRREDYRLIDTVEELRTNGLSE